MDYRICKAADRVDVHRTSPAYRCVPGAAKRVPAVLVAWLLVTIFVFSYQSPALSTNAKPARAKANGHATEKRIPEMERAVLLLTNRERSRAGLPNFEPSPALNYLARGQSRNMCNKRMLQHESDAFPRGWKKFRDRLRIVDVRSGGENVAYLTVSPEVEKWAQQVVAGWMNSAPHKKNILNAKFLYLGVGIAVCTDNLAYATQVFSPDTGRLP